MHLTDAIPPLVVLAAALGYLALIQRKIRAQPYRLELAKTGKWLLKRNDVPTEAKALVEFWLDHAFGLRAHLLVAIILLPLLAPFRASNRRDRAHLAHKIADASQGTQEAWAEFERLTTKVFYANNPVLIALAMTELAVLITIGFAISAVKRALRQKPLVVEPPKVTVLESAVGVVHHGFDGLNRRAHLLVAGAQ